MCCSESHDHASQLHTYLARFSRWSIWPRLHDWSSSCTPRGPFVVGPSGVRQGFIFVRLRTRALRDLGTYENVWGMYIGASWDGLGPQDGAVRSSHARSCVRTTLTSTYLCHKQHTLHVHPTSVSLLFCSFIVPCMRSCSRGCSSSLQTALRMMAAGPYARWAAINLLASPGNNAVLAKLSRCCDGGRFP